MPYASHQQRKYFNANRKALEAQGVNVDEWNRESKGKKLPKKVEPSKEASLFKMARLAVELSLHESRPSDVLDRVQ